MLKKQIKALERMCGHEFNGKQQGNAFIRNGNTFVVDGYKIVVVRNEVPELVEKYPLHPDVQKTIDTHISWIKNVNAVCPLPKMSFLKEFIKEHGCRRSSASTKEKMIRIADEHNIIHAFNVFYLLDVYEALNIGKQEVYAGCRNQHEPIYVGCDEGFAMILPVRHSDTTYDYKGDVM